MRIVAGAWRGRSLAAPPGAGTRPTADRVRQALFDMLLHAPWGGRSAVDGVDVLDVFAGTGAMGLEALSRGAARATFIEQDRAALRALHANIDALGATGQCRVLACDALQAPRGSACGLVFLDPPYRRELVTQAVAGLRAGGWIVPGTLVVAEVGRDELLPPSAPPLAERTHGAARVVVWRE